MKLPARHHISRLWLTIPFVAITMTIGLIAQLVK